MAACQDCGGLGARSAIAGHCFDIDGGLWHEPGECNAPEHSPGGRCCPPCPTCGGSGREPAAPTEPWREAVGRQVVFTYHHGEQEEGVVTSVNDSFVFVRFGTRTSSEACDPARLSLSVEV